MMKTTICLSVGTLDAEFAEMAACLREHAEVKVVGLDGFSLAGCDIFIGKRLSEVTLATADRLKAVFAYKTGVDDFPLPALKEKGVVVVNSHIDADYIAEYAFGLSVSLVNRITECDRKLRRGIWYDLHDPYWKSVFEMKVGLLGYGHIGRQLHRILARNGMTVYTLDRGKAYPDIRTVDSLDALCREVELLVLSLPRTPQTDRLLDARVFRLLRGKYIVNVGRSNCIDEKALYESLKAGELAGAAIDTWDKKPPDMTTPLMPSRYPLAELDNIVLSPHQAMRVDDGHARYVADIRQKVIAYLADGSLTDVVDMDKGY